MVDVIGDDSAKPQPKNGILSSSFLATNASGGKYRFSASVSHVELCLHMITCGVVGMFSAPITCQRTPQSARAAYRFTLHQLRAIMYRGTRGSQNISRKVAA